MTHNIIKTLAVIAMGAILLAGCGKDNGKPTAVQIKQSECGEHFDTQTKDLSENEQYVVEWVDNAARVIHVNWMVPCDYENVTVDVSVDGSIVTINECIHGGGYVNCICSIDNMFTIANLPHGTYTFVFNVCGLNNHQQEYTI